MKIEDFKKLELREKTAIVLKDGQFVGSRKYYGNSECLYLVDESFYAVAIVQGTEPFTVIQVMLVKEENPQYFQMFKHNQDLVVLLQSRKEDGGSYLI